jgi:hypothetical protein
MELSGQLHVPAALPSVHWTCWAGPRDGLEAVAKRRFVPLQGVEPRTSSPYPVTSLALAATVVI